MQVSYKYFELVSFQHIRYTATHYPGTGAVREGVPSCSAAQVTAQVAGSWRWAACCGRNESSDSALKKIF